MKKIRLGKSELLVSRVGFGGIPITRVSCEQAQRCIHTAIDLGINFIDTAATYGDSEEKIGKAIKGHRDKLIIATKSVPSTPEGMIECIDQSLRRLQIETIDLYQFHYIKDEQSLNKSLDLIPVLEKAKDQGKIKHIGATIHGVDYIPNVIEADVFETVMIALNFIVREAADIALPVAIKQDVGIIAMKPMAGGCIDDPRLAFKYFMGMENVVPIVGIESPEQIKQIVKILAEDTPATPEDLLAMGALRKQSGSHFCRRCEYCMPCEQGVDILRVMILKSFGKRLDPQSVIKGVVAEAVQSLENCTQCRECEKKCPYNLGILETFEENKAYYDQLCKQFGPA